MSAADEVMLILCAATSFNGFDRSPTADGRDPLAITAQTLAALQDRTFEELLEAHLAEYQPYFARVALKLGGGVAPTIPTDQRIAAFKRDQDPLEVWRALEAGFESLARHMLSRTIEEGISK